MRIAAFFAALMVWMGLAFSPAHAQAPDHAPFDRLLTRYVVAGADGLHRVNYAAWAGAAADRQALDAYIASLERTRVSTLPRADQFAFWANLYNAVTLDVVLDRYPVRSIRDIRPNVWDIGPWRAERVTVEGRRLSLDNIEHDIMRPTFRDPRVHYAVNCASVGCPNLQREAFRGDRLEAQLNAAARAFINSDRGVQITADGLRLSRIYQWFDEDFGSESELRAHLASFATAERAALIRSQPIVGYGYDWALNDTASRRR